VKSGWWIRGGCIWVKQTYVKNGLPASAFRAMKAAVRAAIWSSRSARVLKLKSDTGVTGDPAVPSQILGISAPDSEKRG
jgi:hypothetical protein